MRNGLGRQKLPEALSHLLIPAPPHPRASPYKHHVAVLVDPELLMGAADAADLRGDPRGAELVLESG